MKFGIVFVFNLSLLLFSQVAKADNDIATYNGNYTSIEGYTAKVKSIDNNRVLIATSEGNTIAYHCNDTYGLECLVEVSNGVQPCDRVIATFSGSFRLFLINKCQNRVYYFEKNF